MKPILNLEAVGLAHHTHGERFEARNGSISGSLGAKHLAYSLCVVPPGKRAWPFHNHHVNEEMFLILDGSGTLRHGDQEYPVRTGDVIASVPGGRETAHQIINTGDRELRYLAVSTVAAHEIVEYPDSGKILMFANTGPGDDRSVRTFQYRGRLGAREEFWDGE